MAAPTQPVNPNTGATLRIPLWCDSGTNKVDPLLTQNVETGGWQNAPGQDYGQIPPFQWVNWTNYQVGQWLNYLCGPITATTGAVPYLQAGNFDHGVSLLNRGELQFFEAGTTGTNYVGLRALPGLTTSTSYNLPVSTPQYSGMVLSSVTGGDMYWAYGSVGVPNPTTDLDVNYIGAQIHTSGTLNVPSALWVNFLSISLPGGVWDLNSLVVFVCVSGSTSSLQLQTAISKFSANGSTPSDSSVGTNLATEFTVIDGGLVSTQFKSLAIPRWRYYNSTASTIYLQVYGSAAGIISIAGGSLMATRVG